MKPAGYDEYIKSAKWRNTSKLMKKIAGYRCAHCGFGSTTLDVHHLTYERFGNERMSDLVVLCKACHIVADQKRVLERELRGENARDEAGYSTYMRKVYGDEWFSMECLENTCEEFYDWRMQQRELEIDNSFEPPDFDDNF